MTITEWPPDQLRKMQLEIARYVEEKGWNENPPEFDESMALLHSEVAEATEAWREHGLADVTERCDLHQPPHIHKPEGVPSEFADIAIRLIDSCTRFRIILDPEFTGAYALYEKFLGNMNKLHVLIVRASMLYELGERKCDEAFSGVLYFLRQLCANHDIDLLEEYRKKMAYNFTRPKYNGGKRI